MTEEAVLPSRLSGYQKLPPTVSTLSGAVFDPSGKRWAFHDGLSAICVNFNRLSEYATEEFVEAAKVPLIWYAENTEASTVAAIFDNLRVLLVSIATARERLVDEIDAPLLITYRASLSSDKEWKLGGLRAFFKKWYRLGVPGVTGDAVRFLNSIRLKGVRKGTAVLTMDPLKGPLTDVERSAVHAALNDAFAVGQIPLDDYLLAWLCLLLGQRNIQFAMLKVCDISEIDKSDGRKEYVLRVPRVKQATAEARREQFKDRLITPSIGKLWACPPAAYAMKLVIQSSASSSLHIRSENDIPELSAVDCCCKTHAHTRRSIAVPVFWWGRPQKPPLFSA